jgi:uncharacterized membrane protein
MTQCLAVLANIQDKAGILDGYTLSLTSIILILVGGITAGIGLLYNNFLIVVGSMLMSPIGNSIIRYSLGFTYNKPYLIGQGINAMIAQIVIALTIGYIMGIVNIEYGEPLQMPTDQMENRVGERNYYTDFIVALLMGFVLAYSLIFTQTTALVGLRLCLAVLPALVNAGLYTAKAHYETDIEKYYENMYKARRSFILVMINLAGVTFTTMLGFYLFCEK